MLDRYRLICAAAGVIPVPDAVAATLLTFYLDCLADDERELQ